MASGIPRECRRLAEVDFPIVAVSRQAAEEEGKRRGHPRSLHKWWARRPLASSRAVLLALLLPDPCDAHCPEEFKRQARDLLSPVRQPPKTDAELRTALLWFIGSFADWSNAAHPTYLQVGQNLVRAAHGGGDPPLVVDPFAGGGSIPLEALRLGCEAFASDLNPVACMILKVMLEDIPRYGHGLVAELRRAGAQLKAEAKDRLADLYPPDPDGATPIAYLWARTVRCEAPNCGAEIPLIRSLWLCKKEKRKWALKPRVVTRGGSEPSILEFDLYQPRTGSGVQRGTVASGRGTCLCCGGRTVLPPDRMQAQLSAQRGGAHVIFDEAGHRVGGARMVVVVTQRPGQTGRHYRLPTPADYDPVRASQERIDGLLHEWESEGQQGLCPVPDELLNPVRPSPNARGVSPVTRYGVQRWADFFTGRQKLALLELASLRKRLSSSGDHTAAARMAVPLCVDKVAMNNNSGCRWKASGESLVDNFGRHALPFVWDFAESNPLGGSTGAFHAQTAPLANFAHSHRALDPLATVQTTSATDHPLPDQSATVWFTDPPYYDAIPYADLSDFFVVWIKRTMGVHLFTSDPYDGCNPLSPKQQECVWNQGHSDHEGRPKDAAFFEATMTRAFAEGRRVLRNDGIGSVVFAHKTTEGWEALLSGMIGGGWIITGSWPLATEKRSRLNARETASLATSIHLVCRPRPEDAPVGDWAEVLRELPARVGDWMERLQGEGIAGADLVFACIGPALEIFSRYSRVEMADGSEVGLPAYLEKVWEVVGRTALENVLGSAEAKARNGLAGALEEDARLTALFLWTLQATSAADDGDDADKGGSATDTDQQPSGVGAKGYSLAFDVARRFAQPLGIDLPKWEKRIIETKKGVVRLLPVAERAKRLFGEDGSAAMAKALEQPGGPQRDLFSGTAVQASELARTRGGARSYADGQEARTAPEEGATTLDRVHTAMLLQARGRTHALRSLAAAERERGPDFERLANALSALYPRGSEEKRLLDAMLLAAPR